MVKSGSGMGLPADVGEDAVALLQGYPTTCFAQVTPSGSLEIPPAFRDLALDQNRDLRWELFWDLRVFGTTGELHAWKNADAKWSHRHRARSMSETDYIPRTYPVWGRRGQAKGGWVLYSEARGADVWIPEKFAASPSLLLDVWQIVGKPEIPEGLEHLNSGLVTIIDAMLVSLRGSSQK